MTKLDFESLEREVNRQNLLKVKHEVINRSSRLRKRIRRFSEQFGVPEEDYWDRLPRHWRMKPDGKISTKSTLAASRLDGLEAVGVPDLFAD